MKRVAINGFGRIGRQVMRKLLSHKDIEVVAINDLVDAKTLAYLLEFDTTYGALTSNSISASEGEITIDGHRIQMFASREPSKLPWKDLNIDVVLECSGVFRDEAGAGQHLEAGAKAVLISAPAGGTIKNIVVGVNDNTISRNDTILSAASCTTNCLAPMMHVLNQHFDIEHGFMATTHAYTGDQRLLDAPHKDLRRARAAGQNIIPTSTGAASAISKVIPSLAGKLQGNALRVPVPSGSITEATVLINGSTTVDEVNEVMQRYSDGDLKGILLASDQPLVSSDILNNSHSCIVDKGLTLVHGNLIRVFGWYDNEVGYSSRMVDVLKLMNP